MPNSNKPGFIYVLTNQSFNKDNWIKIGYSEDVNKRIKELSNSSVPYPFELFCTYEVSNFGGKKSDKLIHDLIGKLNPSLRISPNREFFEMLPMDAYEMLSSIAELHNRKDKLKLYVSDTSVSDTPVTDSEITVDSLFPLDKPVRELFNTLQGIILTEESSLVETATKLYVTYKMNNHNTLSLWPRSGWIEVVLNAKTGQITDDSDMIYDISNRLWSSEQYAFKFNKDTDVDAVKRIVKKVIDFKRQ